MGSIFKNGIRFAILLFFQVYVLDRVHLHQWITPYIYYLFILWLPFKISRAALMLFSFAIGISLDAFHHLPGFHAAACVLMAYVRPFVINLLLPQEGAETNYEEPSYQSMGGRFPYLVYALILILIHNAWLFFLEAWQFADVGYFFGKLILTTLISLLLLLAVELIFSRSQSYRTNTK